MANETPPETAEPKSGGSSSLGNILIILLLSFPLVCVGVAGGIRILQKSMGIEIVPYVDPEEREDPVHAKSDSLDTIGDKLIEQETELVTKRAELVEWEKQLVEREKQLVERERDIATREQAAEALMTRLDVQIDSLETKRITQLAKVYEAMRPEEAASILEALDEATAIQILRRMKQRQAGKILGMLMPERAAAFSDKMSRVN